MKRIIFLLLLSSSLAFSEVSAASNKKVPRKKSPVRSHSLKAAQTSPKTTLEGKWCNQLGSYMELSVNGSDVTGKYVTAVGRADGPYDIRGRRVINEDGSQVVGFVVAWQNEKYGNSHSVATWCGQLQIIDGQEMITTLWLLTRQKQPKDNWESVNINKDVFTRCK